MPEPPSDDALIAEFDRHGFVRVPAFLGKGALAELCQNVERFLREVTPHMPAAEVYREHADDPTTLKQLQQLGRHDPYFAALQESSSFERLASLLLGGNVCARNLQYFDKPPGTARRAAGRPTPPHQDGAYFPIRPNHAITLWLALEDVGEEQGCVRYVRGSHQKGLRDHVASGTLGFSRAIAGYAESADRAREIAVPCQAGDLVAHHSLTIHRCDANRSTTRHRRALGLIYYDARCRVDEEADAAYQRKLAEKLAAVGRIG